MTPTAVERRTRAFYEWEVVGRGWNEYPRTVRLEPPFRPFIRHDPSPAQIDDGRRPSALARFARLIGAKNAAPNVEADSSEPLPEPPPFAWGSRLVECELLVPSEEKVDPVVSSEWLRNVAGARSPLSFEIVSHNGHVAVRFAAEERDAARIRDQTLAFFPAVVVREPTQTLEKAWIDADGHIVGVLEFALAREFMLPLDERSAKTDLLTPLIASLGCLTPRDVAVLQVLFEPVRAPWGAAAMTAVTTPDGEPFFADAPEITKLAQQKCVEALYSTVIRLAVVTGERVVAEDALLGVATAVKSLGNTARNELTPLPTDDIDRLVLSILQRTTHRSGMILSLSDLVALVRLPSPSVRSSRLLRPSTRTKAAPIREPAEFVLGTNAHDEFESTVGLATAERLRHCYVIGASGTGKSTLILSMALQDAAAGNGFAVLDPHGDLIDDILARIPVERAHDVILFDPADEEFPVGFNILSAHTDLERTLLASDLVAVFRRLSTSFGDQMVTVLGNAIAAFLESDKGGTLLDLQRFLADKSFRSRFLSTVRDPQIVAYWRNEFPLLRGNPHAPLLTRLNGFLRPKLIRHMVAQQGERFDIRAIMDKRKILLARLSHGAIGEENAHLLGSLLVAKISQAAMSRQSQPESSRVPFFVYIDEFHHFVTPSVASVLTGARKYALGLTLAHQDMRQLRSRSEDVMSALLANAFTRVVFRVSDQDARALADGFSYFDVSDLQNLGTGEAIARIERPDFDFNLRTFTVDAVDRDVAAARRNAVVVASRTQYATPLTEIEGALHGNYEVQDAPHAEANVRRGDDGRTAKRAQKDVATNKVGEPALPGRGGPQHKYLQSLVRRLAEDRGFRVTVEKTVLDGHGHIDVALERDGFSIACEICVTTRATHEVQNLTKGLAAGFDYAVLICGNDVTLNAARALLAEASDERILFLVPDGLIAFLDQMKAASANEGVVRRRVRSKVALAPTGSSTASVDSKKRLLIARDAAAYLSLAPQTLAKLRWAGGSPPYFKIGRQVVYDPVDLDAWLAVRRKRSTSDPGPQSA